MASDVFSTGQAAKLCRVSQQTIIRCVDNGTLNAFRVPGSRFRRIPRESLWRFMIENSIPLDLLEAQIYGSGVRRMALIASSAEITADPADGIELTTVKDGFDLATRIADFRFRIIVIDQTAKNVPSPDQMIAYAFTRKKQTGDESDPESPFPDRVVDRAMLKWRSVAFVGRPPATATGPIADAATGRFVFLRNGATLADGLREALSRLDA